MTKLSSIQKGSTVLRTVGPFLLLAALPIASGLSGCAYAIKSRITPLAAPETIGRDREGHWPRFSFGADVFTTQDTEISPDKYHALADTRSPLLGQDVSPFGFKAAAAMTDFLDVGVDLGLRGNPEVTAQLQFLGDPRSTSEKGNLAGSVFARVGGGTSDEDQGVNVDRRDASTSHYSIHKNEFQVVWGGSFGYRVSNLVLPYISAVYSRSQFSGTHEVGVQKIESRPFSGYSESKGGLVGMNFRILGTSGVGSRSPHVLSLTVEALWAKTESGAAKGYAWYPAGSGMFEF